MRTPFTEREVNRIFELLTDDQRRFLEEYLQQSKKSKWLEKLAHKKGIVLQKDMSIDEIWKKLNDWELKEILDGGYGKRPYKCECGMSLRFCFIVHHRIENRTYHLGETCLGNYTMLSTDLIKDITTGFHKIDLERDDILKKIEDGWKYPDEYSDLELPELFQRQIDEGLPLSNIQLDKIEQLFKEELNRIRREKELKRMAKYRAQRDSVPQYRSAAPLKAVSELITYDQLLEKNLDYLKKIREHESRINNPQMKKKWESIQQMIKKLKRNENFDYSKFLSQMFELLYYLKLY